MNPSYNFSGIVSIAYFLLEKPDLEHIMKSTNLITEKIVHIKKEESIYLQYGGSNDDLDWRIDLRFPDFFFFVS